MPSHDIPVEVAPAVWCWYARHPEWHPAGFGDLVTNYAVTDPAGVLLVDPLVTEATLAGLDRIARGSVRIVITVPYHVRSADELAERYDGHIYGHAACASRLSDTGRFTAVSEGDAEPGGARFHGIGRPRRQELPVEIPSAGALVLGDSIVTVDGVLRVWDDPVRTERRREWYERRYLPTLRDVTAAAAPRRVLVTHGAPVLDDGARALEDALTRPPWNRHGEA